ncbi:MAG TPA: ABC transporter ATP-binding protein [Thermodesulfobacteriota bacterium]|nr:ABC transporter ATP-binding protein [Thermodesulfobacteriota bacterium]
MNSSQSAVAEIVNTVGPLVRVENLHKSFDSQHKRTEVLKGVELTIYQGETLAIVGASGVGKSTFLYLLGTLDRPTAGKIFYRGEDIFSWKEEKLALFRNEKIGFIFQFHHLIPEFNALENAMMPGLIRGMSRQEAAERAEQILVRVGLKDRLTHKQGELSGGEQQRVAVVRALLLKPEVLLADEPTGDLDTQTGNAIFELLCELNQELGTTMVLVTHNPELARRVPRRVTLVDGRVVQDEYN